MNASVLDVALALCGELLSKIGGVLVFDVFDNGIPAAVVVDEITIAGSVDNVEPETDAVLLDDVRDGVNFGGVANRLVGVEAAWQSRQQISCKPSRALHCCTFRFDKVAGEDSVDQRALSKTSLACRMYC